MLLAIVAVGVPSVSGTVIDLSAGDSILTPVKINAAAVTAMVTGEVNPRVVRREDSHGNVLNLNLSTQTFEISGVDWNASVRPTEDLWVRGMKLLNEMRPGDGDWSSKSVIGSESVGGWACDILRSMTYVGKRESWEWWPRDRTIRAAFGPLRRFNYTYDHANRKRFTAGYVVTDISVKER